MKRVLSMVLALLLIIPMFAVKVGAVGSMDSYVSDMEEAIVTFSNGKALAYNNYGSGTLSIENDVIDSSVDALKIALSTSNMLNLQFSTGYWGGYWYTLNWTSSYNAIRFWASTNFTGGISFDFKLRDGGTTNAYNMTAGSTYYLNGAAATSANGTVTLPDGFSGMVTIPLSGFSSSVDLTNVCAMLIQASPYYGGSNLYFGDMYLTKINSDGSPWYSKAAPAVDEANYKADSEHTLISVTHASALPLVHSTYNYSPEFVTNGIAHGYNAIKMKGTSSVEAWTRLVTTYWGGISTWNLTNFSSNYNAFRFYLINDTATRLRFRPQQGTEATADLISGASYYLNSTINFANSDGSMTIPANFEGYVVIPFASYTGIAFTDVCGLYIAQDENYTGNTMCFGDIILTNIKSDGSPVVLSSTLAVDEANYKANTEYTLINVFTAIERPLFHTITGGTISLCENGFAKNFDSMKLQTTSGTNFVSRTIVSAWGGNSTWSFTDFNLSYNAFRFYLTTDYATKLTLAVGPGSNPDGVIAPDSGAAYYLNGVSNTTGSNGTMTIPANFEGYLVIPFSSYTNAGFNDMCNLYFNVAAADAGAAINIGNVILTNITTTGVAVKTVTPANGVTVSSEDSLCVSPVNGFSYYALSLDLLKTQMTYRADAVTCGTVDYGIDGSFDITENGDIAVTFQMPCKSKINIAADLQLTDTSGNVVVRLFKNSYGFEIARKEVLGTDQTTITADNLVFNEGDFLIATVTKFDETDASGTFVLKVTYAEVNTEASVTVPGECTYTFKGADVYAAAETDVMSFIAGLRTESNVSVSYDSNALLYTANVPTGAVVSVGNDSYTVIVKGDADSTGSVDILDLIIARKQVVGAINTTGAKFAAIDLNSDGTVCIYDLLYLRDMILS